MFGDGGVPGAAGPPDYVGHARYFSARGGLTVSLPILGSAR
jgi:hypothetical protein